jgi:hypothetical protein
MTHGKSSMLYMPNMIICLTCILIIVLIDSYKYRSEKMEELAELDVKYNRDVLLGLSITDRYSNDMSIHHVFEELNLNNSERACLLNVGLTPVQDLVDQHGYDIKAFITYLQTLNKTFATATAVATRVYFSPPIIAQFAGLLFYFNHCINTLHAV